MTSLDFIGQLAWKGTLVLGAAWAAAASLRRRPAALRHFVWTAALTASLLLPAAALLAPKWSLLPAAAPAKDTQTASAPSVSSTALSSNVAEPTTAKFATPSASIASVPRPPASATSSFLPDTTPDWLLILWAAGCCAAAARFLSGAAGVSWILRRATAAAYALELTDCLARDAGIRGAVRVLDGPAVPMPLQWGILRPVILLPQAARDWPAARLKTVLLHELHHVRRYDLLAQAAGQLACCLYWFHPLAWLAARQLREERERACDDAVLLAGVPAHEYAGDLLQLAQAMVLGRVPRFDAPAMAAPSSLESRVRALLDAGRSRAPLNWRTAAATALAALAVLLPSATVSLRAQAPAGSIAGVVTDPSGGRVSYCHVSAKNLDAGNQELAQANEAGEYRFPSIPAGHYTLEFSAPGFARLSLKAELNPAAMAQADAALEVGSIQESVTVAGTGRPEPAARVPVGGVRAARLIQQTPPVYPPELKAAGIQGTVLLSGIISAEGILTGLRVLNTNVDPRFAEAALDAARQWRYQPTLLNGHPVAVRTSIDIDFQ